MNILKNMEIIFVAALGLACCAVYVNQLVPAAQASTYQANHDRARDPAAATPAVPVVTVVAKRMTALEKIQSLRDEQRQASLADNGRQI